MELDLSEVEFSKFDIDKNLRMPTKLDEKLSEEIGIFIGDGYLSKYSNHHEFGICGNLVDDYKYMVGFVKPLMKKLFNSSGSLIISQAQHTIGIRFWSKAVFLFHSKVLGLPIGRKRDSLEIPKKVLYSLRHVLLSCIRGIADTDATLTFKRKHKRVPYYPSIKIELASKRVIEQIAQTLRHDFKIFTLYDAEDKRGYISHRIELNGAENLEKWIKLIGFRNPKHLSKYVFWRKYGFYSPSLTNERLRILASDEILQKNQVAYLHKREIVLRHLDKKPLSIATLVKKTAIHRNTIYSTLKRLEKMGLVIKRDLNWCITAAGIDHLQRPNSFPTKFLD